MEYSAEKQNDFTNMTIQQLEGLNSEILEKSITSSDKLAVASIKQNLYSKIQGVEISNEGLALGDVLMTSLVSSERESWLQFQSDTPQDTLVSENNGEVHQNHQLELWEQLLDFELQAHSQVENKSLPNPENGYSVLEAERWKEVAASPGNPFTDGLDRPSNFSDTDGFGFQEVCQHPSGLCLGPGERKEEHLSVSHDVVAAEQDQVASVQASAPDLLPSSKDAMRCQKSDKQDVEQPVVADDCCTFQEEAMEVFEAPSFMSLVDPETQEMVKASMPEQVRSFAATNHMVAGHLGPGTNGNLQSPVYSENLESSGNKWDALVDSIRLSQQSPGSPSQVTIIDSSREATSFLSRETESLKSAKLAHGSSCTGTPTSSPRTSRLSWLKLSAVPVRNVLLGLSPHFMRKTVQKESTPSAIESKLDSPIKKDKEKPKSIWVTYVCCCNK